MTESAPTVSNAEAEKAKRAEAVNKGYTEAMRVLRERHLEEFNKIRVEATKQLGYDWTPTPTPAEKALAEAKALLEAHPEIADDLVGAARRVVNAPPADIDNPEAPTE